MTELCIWL